MAKKNNSITIPTSMLPPGSKRITNAEKKRVWLINGKEYLSKQEYYQYIVELQKKKEAAPKTRINVEVIRNEAAVQLSDEAINKPVELTSQYWDCECELDYIHPDSQFECTICGTLRIDQPDSRVSEVIAAGLPLKEEANAQ